MVEAHDMLLSCQACTLAGPSETNAIKELDAQKKWYILVKAEESYFCQKSRITWLMDGDNNTSYFHRMENSRKSLNSILFFTDANGNRFDSQEGILGHCIDYFANLLCGDLEHSMLEQDDMNLLLPFRCS